MNILDKEEMIVDTTEQPIFETDRTQFEEDWKNAMSSDEFWKLAGKHIEKVYVARNRR
jgi:hypothetical protein